MKKNKKFEHVRRAIVDEMYRTQWQTDKRLIEFNRDYYIPLMVMMAFLVPIGICKYILRTSWRSAIGGTLMRIVIVWHSTYLVNSLAHYSGDKPYTRNHTSCENKIVSFFAFGEGFHNYHHTYPKDFKASADYGGILNLSAQLLRMMHKLGLVWDCKYVKTIDRKNRDNPINCESIKYSVM
jgi:stearoyl-CoA desaturase (delta-9 desaturase)